MITIYAKLRRNFGKKASRKIRLNNKIPAIIYDNKNTIPIIIDSNLIILYNNLEKIYESVFVLILEGKEIKVKIQSIQNHPFKKKFMHIDFILI